MLTSAVVKTANAPGTVWDDKVRGLGLRTYPGGAKTFVFMYRIDGRQRLIKVGRSPEWTLDAARARAKELRREADRGRDPAGEKRKRRNAPTIQNLVDRYIAEHLPTKGSRARKIKLEYLKKTIQYRENDEKRMLAEIAKRLGKHTKVADVHGGDIKEMHHGITEARGPVRANRILSVCSKMFALSLVPMARENKPWRDQAQGNPCKGIAKNYEEPKERFFSQRELAAIGDALNEYGAEGRGPGIASAQSAADCVRLIMLTGCRPQEGMLAQWPELDKEPGYWIKPSAHVKAGKEHKLPLGPAAIELVERLRKKRKAEATWLFPGQKRGQPLAQLWHVWHWVRDRAGLGADARLYDLRHTFASVGAGGGLSLQIVGKLLGHTQVRTTQRYGHIGDDPLREAAEKIDAVIAGAGKQSAEVVRIGRKGS
jgi:integrase